jgi:hypothetical protein
MNQETTQKSNIGNFFAFIFAVGLAVVGYLYYEETQKLPEEKIREVVKLVPVEKVKEVIKEVEKEVQVEVPAELNEYQQLAINFTANYLSAPTVASLDEVFYGIKGFNTKVILGDDVKKVVSEERLRNKLELILRRNGISIDPESYYTLMFYVDGFWDEDEIRLTYKYDLNLLEDVVLARNGDIRRSPTYTWNTGTFGYAGKTIAEKTMLENVESVAEAFSNRYLKLMDKEKRKIEQDSGANVDSAAAPSP